MRVRYYTCMCVRVGQTGRSSIIDALLLCSCRVTSGNYSMTAAGENGKCESTLKRWEMKEDRGGNVGGTERENGGEYLTLCLLRTRCETAGTRAPEHSMCHSRMSRCSLQMGSEYQRGALKRVQCDIVAFHPADGLINVSFQVSY